MVNFIMLVGLPGSGKSHLAEFYKNQDFAIYSSDDIREELSGDVNRQDINSEVFKILHKRVKDSLKDGMSCLYDATNIIYKRRKAFLEELKNIECVKTCIVVATPYEVCLEQNQQRERKVPNGVIERMYRNFDVPYWYEGWDDIQLYYGKDTYKEAYGPWSQFIFDTLTFEQDNKYHNETLGEHCRQCLDYVVNYNLTHSSTTPEATHAQIVAAAIHDCGKPFCKTFVNTKGETTDNAHYYFHEHVGSYNSLFFNTEAANDNIRLYIATLIRWHMQMHFIDNEPHLKEKYVKLLGHTLYTDLEILHAGDLNSH